MRSIALDCGLTEALKWGCPCYMHQKTNIVLIHGFKDYCAYLFFKGVLLSDTKKILIRQTKNVQSARQIRFTNAKEIDKLKSTLKAYIFQFSSAKLPKTRESRVEKYILQILKGKGLDD